MNSQMLFLLASEVPAGRVFGLDQQTLIQIGIQLFNMSILAYVMAKLLYKPVKKFLQSRADKVTSQLEQAADDMSKANALKLEYEGKLRDIAKEKEAIMEEARRNAAERGKEIVAEAKAEADAVKARARAEIEAEQERVKAEMKQSIIEASAAMSAKFLVVAMDDATRDKLFSETMAELEEITWQS